MAKRDGIYSHVDPNNGNIVWDGPLETTKGDHEAMTPRTDSYLPGEREPQGAFYDRGHINASSLSPHSTNDPSNIAPMASDLNRVGGAYYAMEQGERAALQNGATIDSTKTAVVNGQPGDKPQAFLVSDTVTYADGHTETIHHSFTNISNAEQQAFNDACAALPDDTNTPNPGDGLRDSMTSAEYTELMESTDPGLPCIAEDYAPADFSGLPGAESAAPGVDDTAAEAGLPGMTTGTAASAAPDAADDITADAGSADASVGNDGSATCDPDD